MDAPFPTKMMPCIEQFLSKVHPTLPYGLDIYPEVFATEFFFPLQRMREMEKMIALVREHSPATIMEIGIDKGASLYHWAKCFPPLGNPFSMYGGIRRLIGVEIRGIPYDGLFRNAFPQIDFLFYQSSSYDPVILPYVKDWLTSKYATIDVLFIDGDKTAFDLDFNSYLPMMADDGIVILHDINPDNKLPTNPDIPLPYISDPYPNEPRGVFKRIQEKGYRIEVIIDTSEVGEALDNMVLGMHPANPYEGWLRYWQGRSCGYGVVFLDGRKDTI